MNEDFMKYADQIQDLLISVNAKYRNFMHEQMKKQGFNLSEILLMRELHIHPKITLKDLSQKLGIAKSTLSVTIERLVERGLVNRERPDDNRRIIQLSLAPDFFDLKDSFKMISCTNFADHMAGTDLTDLKQISESLKKLDIIMST